MLHRKDYNNVEMCLFNTVSFVLQILNQLAHMELF